MNDIKIEMFTAFDEDLKQIIVSLERQIFPKPISYTELESEIKSKYGLIALVAFSENTPCAFKVGFEQSPQRFYSWISGTHPDYRNKGIAQSLMKKQHEIVKEKGYKYITTQTKNEFKEMLILNIKSGFEINGIRQSLNSEKPAILLEKKL